MERVPPASLSRDSATTAAIGPRRKYPENTKRRANSSNQLSLLLSNAKHNLRCRKGNTPDAHRTTAAVDWRFFFSFPNHSDLPASRTPHGFPGTPQSCSPPPHHPHHHYHHHYYHPFRPARTLSCASTPCRETIGRATLSTRCPRIRGWLPPGCGEYPHPDRSSVRLWEGEGGAVAG